MLVAKLFMIFLLFFYGYETKNVFFGWDISSNDYFKGFVYKNSNYIRIYPNIKLKSYEDLKVCNFILISKDGADLPFLASLKSSASGTGELIVTGPINNTKYVFYIQAKACNKNVFSKEVKVVINTVDDEVPRWEQVEYNVGISGDVFIGAEVVRVRAYEYGRSAGNSICDYKITYPSDIPFNIDKNGVIRTTDLLNSRANKTYLLKVTAIDCWLPVAHNSSTVVNIEVIEVCKFGWTGVYEKIDYQRSSGLKRLGRAIKFANCDKSVDMCRDQEVVVQLLLLNSNTRICDRDYRSLRHQWRNCGIQNDTIEILPPPNQFQSQDHNNGEDVSHGVFTFDGSSTQWEIPTNIVSSDHYLGDNFTLSFWMKHEPLVEEQKHKKEQILCNSDGNEKNRHHYSLFLHHCKLIFLYRNESSSESRMSQLTPAEWRFKSNEICDGNWHHYVLMVETVVVKNDNKDMPFPKQYSAHKIKLFIDGATFPYNIDNPEIIDDIPMHAMSEILSTKLSVGACWHSRSANYIQHFKGEMAGITLLRGHLESPSVIECINQCLERLVFTGINKMAPRTSISINSLMSSLTVTTSNVHDATDIINQMGYINSRWIPKPGTRSIEFNTKIKCSNDIKFEVPHRIIRVLVQSKNDKFKTSLSKINAIHDKESILHISGDELIEVDSQYVITPGVGLGLPILPNVMVTDVSSDYIGSLTLWGKHSADGNKRQYKLNGISTIESCLLHIHPPLDKKIEYLAFTNSIIEDLSDQGIHLNVTNSSLGLVIEGKQSLSIYRFILQRIVYFNSQLDQFQDKLLKLVCSKHSAHSVSNELKIRISLSNDVRNNVNIMKFNSHRIVHTIHQDEPMDIIDHQAQSEISNFHVGSSGTSSVTKNRWNHIVAIFGLCSIVIIIIAGFVLERIVARQQNRIGDRIVRSMNGPWMRLKTLGCKVSFTKLSTLPRYYKRHSLAGTRTGEMEWDSSELCTKSQMDASVQIIVNPLSEHEKNIHKSSVKNCLSVNPVLLDHEERSLDGLPDEYDGHSEDFRDIDDDMTIEEEDSSSVSDDIDNGKFYQNGKSVSYNSIYDDSRFVWPGHVNIHNNPRFDFRKTFSN